VSRFGLNRKSASPPPGRLDEVDAKIVEVLQADARKSARAVAREMEMSPGAVSERIARLERAGIIKGYSAEVDPAALGLHVRALVGIEIQQGPSLNDVIAVVRAIPEIAGVFVTSGKWDLVVIVQVRDGEHLRHVILDKLWRAPGFRHSETMLILSSHTEANTHQPRGVASGDGSASDHKGAEPIKRQPRTPKQPRI
jgi:Lrp/AsnC family leucine-responsive transcriptional regulator